MLHGEVAEKAGEKTVPFADFHYHIFSHPVTIIVFILVQTHFKVNLCREIISEAKTFCKLLTKQRFPFFVL